MINWNGKRRWVALGMLIAGIIVMLTIPPIIPVIQLPGEVYPEGWSIFGLRLTNSLVGSLVVWILLVLLVVYVQRVMPKSGNEVPRGGFYNMFEMLYEGLSGFILNITGEKHFRFIFSFFMTIFLLVLLSNWLELIPGVDSIGFLEPHTVVNVDTGEVVYEKGYEVAGSGVYTLNPKCAWVSPADAALLTADEQQARADAGCVTGAGQTNVAAPIPGSAVVEPVVTEAAAETAATEVAASAESSGHAATDTGTEVLAPSALEGEHIEAGSSEVPWVVLPFVRAPSTDLNMTAALALIAVIMTQVIGFRALGPSYLTKFFNFKTLLTSPLGGIDLAVGLLELIGEFAKILSFSFRLLGNIFAGSILLFVMSFLVPFLPWPFFILEFFVGVIQAVVFGMLTAIFMTQATAGHGGEHEAEHAVDVAEAH